MLRNSTSTDPVSTSRESLPGYMQRGWVGQDEQGRSGGALTLEYAIDDAAMLPAIRAFDPANEAVVLRGTGAVELRH